jgi:hypothetical protein
MVKVQGGSELFLLRLGLGETVYTKASKLAL